MRCTQFMGLPYEASEFIHINCETVKNQECPHCEEVISYKIKKENYKDASNYGMFDDGPMLSKYYLKDGRVVFEEVQCAPWSSGPMIFLKLTDDQGNDLFVWSEEDVNNI